MALIRVAQYSSTPTVVGDYQAQNAHLQAFTNQLLTQQFILDAGIAKPVIKQGCYVSHGGSLYVADADTSITGSPSDGSVYIRVSGTTSLTVEFVTNISGYTWNPVYSALTSTTYTLLPYLIVKASTVWTRYNFNPNNQQFGSLASLAVTGNATVGGTLGVTGAISGASVTSSGAVEASAAQGFISKDYVTGARNPIWHFAEASSQYGMSYFQGTSGIGNVDTIGMHFGNATVSDSQFKFIGDGNFQCASVDTGSGANEVFKTSTQTIEAYTESSDVTSQLSAMDIGEVRHVYYSCRGGSYYAHLKTPAGGNFYISPVTGVSDSLLRNGGSYAGNTNFASFTSSTVTGVFTIRRNS